MNHCTLWIEGWWSACCAAHDAAYTGLMPRAAADDALAYCVIASAPGWAAVLAPVIAIAMGVAVRLFGGGFYRGAPR